MLAVLTLFVGCVELLSLVLTDDLDGLLAGSMDLPDKVTEPQQTTGAVGRVDRLVQQRLRQAGAHKHDPDNRLHR